MRVKLILATLATLAAAPAVAEPSHVDRAVIAFFAANNRVQLAVERDACADWDMFEESRTGRARLRKSTDRRSYDKIASLIGAAYRASEGTDSAVEAVKSEFCQMAEIR
jgi:hypothetical protein